MPSGGPRKPAHPAPVSGPGSLSRRTDGKPGQKMSVPTGLDYGDAAALHAQESLAPMGVDASAPQGQAPSRPGSGGGAPAGAGAAGGGPGVVGFDEPTQRPDEPVTAGVPIGPGPGTEALQGPTPVQVGAGSGAMTSLLQGMSATDTTGILGQLMQAAQARGA